MNRLYNNEIKKTILKFKIIIFLLFDVYYLLRALIRYLPV